MTVYEQIRQALPGDEFSSAAAESCCVLFPRGVVTVPADDVIESKKLREEMIRKCKQFFPRIQDFTHMPLIVYDLLSPQQGWTNARPSRDLRDAYLARLREAIDFLNTAKVAHLDLRNANIMWRVVNETDVEMKIIDFDFAVPFGELIPEWLVMTVSDYRDWRYPFRSSDREQGRVKAGKIHNEFYVFAINAWFENAEDQVTFDEYMRSRDGEKQHDLFFSSCPSSVLPEII